jgi:hypothetical protein
VGGDVADHDRHAGSDRGITKPLVTRESRIRRRRRSIPTNDGDLAGDVVDTDRAVAAEAANGRGYPPRTLFALRTCATAGGERIIDVRFVHGILAPDLITRPARRTYGCYRRSPHVAARRRAWERT